MCVCGREGDRAFLSDLPVFQTLKDATAARVQEDNCLWGLSCEVREEDRTRGLVSSLNCRVKVAAVVINKHAQRDRVFVAKVKEPGAAARMPCASLPWKLTRVFSRRGSAHLRVRAPSLASPACVFLPSSGTTVKQLRQQGGAVGPAPADGAADGVPQQLVFPDEAPA